MRPVRIVIQGRLSSSRLPAKALLPIAGLPSIVLCARRAANRGAPVVVATSDDLADEVLVRELDKHGVHCVRGPLDDVLMRFVQATDDMPDEGIVVRLTADNVFPDGEFLEAMLQNYMDANVDYLGTRSPQDGLPYGLSAEIFSVRVLRLASRHASSAWDLEHVTPWMLRECACQIYRPVLNRNYGHLRATIDKFDDYIRVCGVFRGYVDPINVSWHSLCRSLAALPEAPAFRVPWRERNGELHSEMTLGTVQLGMPYGAANITGQPTAKEAETLLKKAIIHGITSIDCASAYGSAEAVVGHTFPGECRDAVHIVTKLDPLAGLEEGVHDSTDADSAAELSVYRSLHRLQRRRIDTLLLHRWRHRTDFGGAIWSSLLRLKAEGLIGRLGVSVYSPAEAMTALADPAVEHIQLPLNILDWRWRSQAFLQAVRQRPDIVLHARSAYLQGILVGCPECWPKLEGVDARIYVDMLDTLVRALGRVDRADLCLAYVRSHPWVTSTVVGVETLAQLDGTMGYFLNPVLSYEEREYVDRSLPKAPFQLLDPSQWRQSAE